MTRSPARPFGSDETPHEVASRWIREGLDHAKSKPDGWAAAMLGALNLKAKSYVHRWLTGEQQVPLQAVIASASSHPEVVEHIARELARMVGKVLADSPKATDCLNDFHAFAQLGSSAGKVLEEVGRALSDGHIDRGEAISMIAALDSLIEAAASYRARLQVVVRDGVDGARGLRAVDGGSR